MLPEQSRVVKAAFWPEIEKILQTHPVLLEEAEQYNAQDLAGMIANTVEVLRAGNFTSPPHRFSEKVLLLGPGLEKAQGALNAAHCRDGGRPLPASILQQWLLRLLWEASLIITYTQKTRLEAQSPDTSL